MERNRRSKKECSVCGIHCVLPPHKPPITVHQLLHPQLRTAHQPIYSQEELAHLSDSPKEIIGPDTALFWYQEARSRKDYEESNRIQKLALEMGYKIGFAKTYYEAFYI